MVVRYRLRALVVDGKMTIPVHHLIDAFILEHGFLPANIHRRLLD